MLVSGRRKSRQEVSVDRVGSFKFFKGQFPFTHLFCNLEEIGFVAVTNQLTTAHKKKFNDYSKIKTKLSYFQGIAQSIEQNERLIWE